MSASPAAVPVTAPLRPAPAGSLQDRFVREFLPVGVVVGVALAALFHAAEDWIFWSFSVPRQPVSSTLAAILFTTWAVWWIRRMFTRIGPLNLGIHGERFIADFLDYDRDLRGLHYRAIHDIPFSKSGRSFNVDHVLIGPGGVFAIETKLRKKRGNARIRVRGDTIEVDGHEPDRDPIEQALACAAAVAEVLRCRAGHAVDVRPILLFPGWYIDGRHPKVWILSYKELPKWLEQKTDRLTEAEAARYETLILDHVAHSREMESK